MTIAILLAALTFLVAAAWTWWRRRGAPTDGAISVGLALVGVAMALRIPQITDALEGLRCGPEAIKHTLIVVATVTLVAYIRPRSFASPGGRTAYLVAALGAPVVMLTTATIAGPWNAELDLLPQSYTTLVMVPYWLTFYGSTTVSLAMLTWTAVQSVRSARPDPPPAHALLLAAGGILAVVWAVTGPATWISLLVDRPGVADAIEEAASPIVMCGALALVAGIVLPSIIRAVRTIDDRRNLTALHTYLSRAVPETALAGGRTARSYHRRIEIFDALATLQSYTPDAPVPVDAVEMAEAVRTAATRHHEGRFRTAGQDWSGWFDDPGRLVELGACFVDELFTPPKAAVIVSRITQPALTVPLGLGGVGFVAGGWPWAGLSLLLAAGLPVGMVFGLRAGHVLDSLRVPDRHRRLALLWLMVAMEIAVGVLYHLLSAPPALTLAQFAMSAGLAALAVCTAWTRISVHTAVVGIMTAALVGVGGTPYLVLAALLALVAWARYAVRAHTFGQVLLGVVVPPLVTAGVLLLG